MMRKKRTGIGKKRGAGELLPYGGRNPPRRIWCFAVLLLTLLLLSEFAAFAADDGTEAQTGVLEEAGLSLPSEYGEVVQGLPDEVKELLPEGTDGSDADLTAKAAERMSEPGYWKELLVRVTGVELGEALRLFARLCALLALSSVFAAVRSSFGSDSLSKAIGFCSTGAIFAAILHIEYRQLEAVSLFFERLNSLMLGMIPVTGTLWAMGGNVNTAAMSGSTLYVFLTVSEQLCARLVIPVCGILTALALCNSLSPEVGLRSLGNAIRKVYTFFLGLVMTLLLALLSSQNTLCAAADSTGARTAKLVSSTIIPTVGGSVGETLRTVASGVQYLKSVVGISGIFFILLLLLPTLISLLLTRLAFLLGSGVAEILGCEGEGKLLGELGSVYGCMTSVVAMTSVMFILALNLFVRTATALM